MKPKPRMLVRKVWTSILCVIILLSHVGILFTLGKVNDTQETIQVAQSEQIEEVEDTRENIQVTSRGEIEREKQEYVLYELVINEGEQSLIFQNKDNAEEYQEEILNKTNNLEVHIEEFLSDNLECVHNEEIIEEITEDYISKYHKPTTHFPAVSHKVSSTYGSRPSRGDFHTGIDLCGSYGENIYAYKAGTVIKVQYSNSSYGNMILIQHNNGMQTRYAHLSSIDVSMGESVGCGEIIGGMGSTGNSTGVHLHFEVIIGGSTVNPYNYIF